MALQHPDFCGAGMELLAKECLCSRKLGEAAPAKGRQAWLCSGQGGIR